MMAKVFSVVHRAFPRCYTVHQLRSLTWTYFCDHGLNFFFMILGILTREIAWLLQYLLVGNIQNYQIFSHDMDLFCDHGLKSFFL